MFIRTIYIHFVLNRRSLMDKLEAIKFFAESVIHEMAYIKKMSPTKKEVMDNLDQWLNTIATIVEITNEKE